ncbi:MAG: hypothetical protein H6830_07225 [Planctomycetes bacterium]|nr:hypothetical protein [Planctomycetota bacterium]MCB9911432.1 hypothetical protein [Planctomycetota bacterium]
MLRPLFLIALIAAAAGGAWWIVGSRMDAPRPALTIEPEAQDSPMPAILAPANQDPVTTPSPSAALQSKPLRSGREDLSALNQRAIEALEAQRYDEAVRLFDEARQGDPEEPVFQANLAEAYARWAVATADEELALAIERLEKAIVWAPGRAELVALLERLRTRLAAEADFVEDQSLHFTLHYDGDRADLLSRGYLEVLDDLEGAYQDYGEFFDVFPVEAGRPKFRALLYDRAAFDNVTGIGEWAGGAYDGSIRVPVRNFERERGAIRHTLRHELVHAFIEEVGGKRVAGWLNEGLAQYLSFEGNGARATGVERARQRLAGQTLFSLTQLTGTLASLQDPARVTVAYDQALGFTDWLAVHYGERTLVHLVTASKGGEEPAARFLRLVGVELEVVHQDFVDSL